MLVVSASPSQDGEKLMGNSTSSTKDPKIDHDVENWIRTGLVVSRDEDSEIDI